MRMLIVVMLMLFTVLMLNTLAHAALVTQAQVVSIVRGLQ